VIVKISRTYLLLALAASLVLSPLPYSAVAMVLLLLQGYSFWRPLRAELALAFTLSTLVLLPLLLEPVAGMPFSAFLVIPALPLLDHALRKNAAGQLPRRWQLGRSATDLLIALAASLVAVLIAGTLLALPTLAVTSALLIAYVIALVAYNLWAIPKVPLEESTTWTRVVAGNSGTVDFVAKGKGRLGLHLCLRSPYDWLQLEPTRLHLAGEEAKIRMSLTPPLAGPTQPQIEASTIDPWGLTQTNQILRPLELYVIPRARYARWLARRYLEQTTPGAGAVAVTPPSRALRGERGGMEYYGSRLYEPGDPLRHIDWKHTLKLQRFVVKEHIEGRTQSAIIAVNLAVKDAEEADRLAYDLITSALTFAAEAVPTALAAYTHEATLMATPVSDPRETLKRTLKLAQNIVLIQFAERFLQPPDIEALRRAKGKLEQAKTESGQKLVEILQLQLDALQQAAKGHPATRALTQAAERTRPPAMIAVISRWNHDAEALVLALEKLKKRGFRSMAVDIKGISPAHSLISTQR